MVFTRHLGCRFDILLSLLWLLRVGLLHVGDSHFWGIVLSGASYFGRSHFLGYPVALRDGLLFLEPISLLCFVAHGHALLVACFFGR